MKLPLAARPSDVYIQWDEVDAALKLHT